MHYKISGWSVVSFTPNLTDGAVMSQQLLMCCHHQLFFIPDDSSTLEELSISTTLPPYGCVGRRLKFKQQRYFIVSLLFFGNSVT